MISAKAPKGISLTIFTSSNGINGVTSRNELVPGILSVVLMAKGDLVLFLIEGNYIDINLVAYGYNFTWLLDAVSM